MNLFRSVLFWLVLAVFGALLAQLLLQDPGYVLVRFRGTDYQTSVAAGAGLLLLFLLALALLWGLLRLPFKAWRQHRQRQARARLTDDQCIPTRRIRPRRTLLQQRRHPASGHADNEALARTHAARAPRRAATMPQPRRILTRSAIATPAPKRCCGPNRRSPDARRRTPCSHWMRPAHSRCHRKACACAPRR